MTDNEIIKALECLCDYELGDCHKCPIYKHIDKDCTPDIVKPALDLINRKKAEIENYSHNTKTMANDIRGLQKALEQAKAEIERLKKEVKKCKEHYKMACSERNEFLEQLETAKAEAIKEFAERLKNECVQDGAFGYVSAYEIDNLVKEMVGESNV